MRTICLIVIALLVSLTPALYAQEDHERGRMWTFEDPPLDDFESAYGFRPDQEWLDALRLGSLRLGGEDVLARAASASFVSPNGLILTSARNLRDAIGATVGNGGLDHRRSPLRTLKSGFVAAGERQEVRLKSGEGWLTVAQLVSTTDVTDEVNHGVRADDSSIRAKAKRDVNKQAILDEASRTDPKLVPQIVSLYHGAVVQLYQYRVYDDVRLVAHPHVQLAYYGGDTDDAPGYALDFAFLRAYEDGKPADTTDHYFTWASGGAEEGELVFVSGNNGTTRRLFTMAQLEFERDIRIPMMLESLENRLRIMDQPVDDPGLASWDYGRLHVFALAMKNGVKTARGNLRALQDAQLMARRAAAEQAFKDRVMADTDLEAQYGDLWDRIEHLISRRRQHEARARFHVPNHFHFGVLVAIVRMLDPAESDERREQARKTVDSWAGVTSPVMAWPSSAFVQDQFRRARTWLPEHDPFFTKVLDGKSIDAFGVVMMQDTPSWLGHPEQRDALVRSGWEGIQASEDPMVIAARELAILMREHERLGEELDAEEEALGAELGRAYLATYGTRVSPDGTLTLRFTDGVVSGVRTTFDDIYARSAEFDNEYPFNLPQAWLDRKDAIAMTKSVNFVSTNDTTSRTVALRFNRYGTHHWDVSGGNAGSVVVNSALEVVGVVVGGNVESLQNDVVFNDDVSRTISVHVDGIMEALVKLYDAQHIAEELTGR